MTEAASASESGRVPRIDDSEMYWHECTSKNGKKYHIGVARADHPGLTDQNFEDLFDKAATRPEPPHPKSLQSTTDGLLDTNVVGHGGDGGRMGTTGNMAKISHTTGDVPIYWPYAGNNDTWVKTVQRIKDLMDIKRYSLSWNNGGWYDYKLRVDITQAWNYRFYDDGGDNQDSYTLYCWVKGEHSVCYDSGHPTIVKIDAWD